MSSVVRGTMQRTWVPLWARQEEIVVDASAVRSSGHVVASDVMAAPVSGGHIGAPFARPRLAALITVATLEMGTYRPRDSEPLLAQWWRERRERRRQRDVLRLADIRTWRDGRAVNALLDRVRP